MRHLTDVIEHRGPDDQGVWAHERVLLGFRRLAILDLSALGHQPMVSADGTHAMVFNGEIYNYLELRTELEAAGVRFRSTGDSEVLLAAYRVWGRQCVERLVGMYAFCIYDIAKGELFLGRDRFGIKPLYYVRSTRGLLFASEIKVLRAAGLTSGAINEARFASFLSLGRSESVHEDTSSYLAGVEQLPAGAYAVLTLDGDLRVTRYWQPTASETLPAQDAVEGFARRFDDAMRLHMRADVPVGVMLSGGMDSVSIACEMAAMARRDGSTQPLHAFCYMSDDFDERPQLEDTYRATGVTVHQLADRGAQHFWSQLDDLIWYHDEPVHSPSVLMGYELYRLAKETGIRVVMSGQGADETIGGYHYMFDHALVSLALAGRIPSLLAQARETARLTGADVQAVLSRIAKMVRAHLLGGVSSYASVAASRRLAEGPGRSFLAPAFAALAAPQVPSPAGQDLASAMIRAQQQTPLPQYLRVEDRNSMAHSVESRVPFLDHRLAEYASALPLEWKLWNGWNKRVLRDSMQQRIPDSVRLRRQKFGFPTSARRWFREELSSLLRDVIASGSVMRQGWFDRAKVESAFARHQQGQLDATNLLFNVAQLDAWLRWHEKEWRRTA